MSKKSEMPYTCAFLQEVFRFRTLTPLALPHKLTNDTVFEGFFLPKGTKVSLTVVSTFFWPRATLKKE